MRYGTPLALILMGTWLLWSGHYTPLLLGLGLASCVGVVLLLGRLGGLDAEAVPLRAVPRALGYLPWLALQVVRSSLDVARRIVAPGPPIAPRVIRVPVGQSTELGRAIYANSITLTPGTVAMRFEGDELLVHALTAGSAAELDSREMERRVRRVEGGGADA